jgi:hypothetical protein
MLKTGENSHIREDAIVVQYPDITAGADGYLLNLRYRRWGLCGVSGGGTVGC